MTYSSVLRAKNGSTYVTVFPRAERAIPPGHVLDTPGTNFRLRLTTNDQLLSMEFTVPVEARDAVRAYLAEMSQVDSGCP